VEEMRVQAAYPLGSTPLTTGLRHGQEGGHVHEENGADNTAQGQQEWEA